jgi:rod shape-determining protein MreD
MSLDQKNLRLLFFIALSLILFIPSIFPSFRISFFAPVLVIAFYQGKLSTSLGYALAAGISMDLLSSADRLGLHALIYSFTCVLLYSQKKNFFADSLTTLPIMTFFFSSLSTLMLFVATDTEPFRHMTVAFIFSDLFFLPGIDGLLSFLILIFPFLLLGQKPKKGTDYFLSSV